MTNILDAVLSGWLLVVSPGFTDYAVEVLAEVDGQYDTLYECQLMVVEYERLWPDDHAWCEPI